MPYYTQQERQRNFYLSIIIVLVSGIGIVCFGALIDLFISQFSDTTNTWIISKIFFRTLSISNNCFH